MFAPSLFDICASITKAKRPAFDAHRAVSQHSRQHVRSLTTPTRIRFLTERRAEEDDSAPLDDSAPVAASPGGDEASDDTAAEEEAVPKSPLPVNPEIYSGLLTPPPAEKGDAASTTDYPINLPSYLLLVLATVASIAFTGSIFEVTGTNPEVRGKIAQTACCCRCRHSATAV